MPLDHVNGERIEGMDDVFVIAPFEKYAEQTRLTTTLKIKEKFKREREVEKPIISAAMEHAATAYAKLGIRVGSDVEIMIQEYPRTKQVCVIFCTTRHGQDYLVTAPFQLADEQIKDLTFRGLWTPYTLQ